MRKLKQGFKSRTDLMLSSILSTRPCDRFASFSASIRSASFFTNSILAFSSSCLSASCSSKLGYLFRTVPDAVETFVALAGVDSRLPSGSMRADFIRSKPGTAEDSEEVRFIDLRGSDSSEFGDRKKTESSNLRRSRTEADIEDDDCDSPDVELKINGSSIEEKYLNQHYETSYSKQDIFPPM